MQALGDRESINDDKLKLDSELKEAEATLEAETEQGAQLQERYDELAAKLRILEQEIQTIRW